MASITLNVFKTMKISNFYKKKSDPIENCLGCGGHMAASLLNKCGLCSTCISYGQVAKITGEIMVILRDER